MAHNDTVFAQVLKLVPRHEFESLARKHKSGRMSRSMTRWGQFVAMGMAQLTGRCSLRDIVSNLAAQSCKLYHLGVGVVTRSSLARVNAEKPWEMYEELHGRLLGRCQAKAPGHGYRFKAKLFSVDSTTIDLCLSAFPWAKFRRTKGAVKVHVGLDHEGYLPTFVRVTNGKTSDIEAARALTLPKGSIVAADRAYVDFAWIDSLISEGIHLVTRLKRGIKYGVVETREVNAKRGVTSDETIEFTSAKGRKQCPHRLRRIGYHDRKTGKDYVFLTTHFHLSAKTIADIYKSRWQVELFFKWIKQNLKVKSFVGTSRNAVMTQVWTAMCMYLIPVGRSSVHYDLQVPGRISLRNPTDSTISTRVALQASDRPSPEEIRRRYREEVEYLDEQIGVLLSALREASRPEDTLIIFTADHGEELFEHGPAGHVPYLYDTVLRVPLFVVWQGRLAAGTVVDEFVSHIDLLPTILEWLRIPDPVARSGRSLRPLVASPPTAFAEEPVVSETFRPEAPVDLKALVAGGRKLIFAPADNGVQLFDLASDPEERDDLANRDSATAAYFSQRLGARLAEARQRAIPPERQAITEEEIQRLRALGYLR